MKRAKVFCVGISKTGTTSFAECMVRLGYRHLRGFASAVADLYLEKNLAAIDHVVEQHDSFDDWPWPALFQRYARKYPDAKFVLTVRKTPHAWLSSYMNHCETYLFYWHGFERYNRAFFGASFPHGQEDEHLRAYLAHEEHVTTSFRDRPERLLRLCFETDPVWEKLCTFLDCEVRGDHVPHVNTKVPGIPIRRRGKSLLLQGYGRLEKLCGVRCAIRYEE